MAVTSRREEKGQEFAAVCRELNVGDPAVYTDVREMVRQSDVDVVYILAPNYLRSFCGGKQLLERNQGGAVSQSMGHCPGEALSQECAGKQRGL